MVFISVHQMTSLDTKTSKMQNIAIYNLTIKGDRVDFNCKTVQGNIVHLVGCCIKNSITLFTTTFINKLIHQSFIYSPTDALVSGLKKQYYNFNIKIYIKTAPTCFGITVTPSSGSALICA